MSENKLTEDQQQQMIGIESIEDFRKCGLLAAVNTVFFHPLGLALSADVEGDGFKLFKSKDRFVWDVEDLEFLEVLTAALGNALHTMQSNDDVQNQMFAIVMILTEQVDKLMKAKEKLRKELERKGKGIPNDDVKAMSW